MKPNIPNSKFEQKTFAKLSRIGIVGRSVSQSSNFSAASESVSLSQIKKIASEVFESTTPSMVKGDTGDKGDKGDRGPTGAIGATGPKGDQGDPGIPDAQVITITVCTASGAQQIEVYAPAEVAEE